MSLSIICCCSMMCPEARGSIEGGSIKPLHCLVKTVHVLLNHLHRLEMLLLRPAAYPVFSRFIDFVLKVPDVSDVAHIPDFISEVQQVSVQHIERYCRPCMTQMRLAVNGGAADIHAGKRRRHGFEQLFFTGEGVIQVKGILHCIRSFCKSNSFGVIRPKRYIIKQPRDNLSRGCSHTSPPHEETPHAARQALKTACTCVDFQYKTNLSLIHISEPTRRTPISYAVFCL